MKRLIGSLAPFDGASSGYTADDWNATVRREFGAFLSPDRLEASRELLRTELVNLARIHNRPDYTALLRWSVDVYRAAAAKDQTGVADLFSQALPHTVEAQQKYLSAFLAAPTPDTPSVYDVVQSRFATIDLLLEGVMKPYVNLLFHAALAATGTPAPGRRIDFGELVATFPRTSRTIDAGLLFADPTFGISTNQWRNIAAHRTFKVVSADEVLVTYGLGTPPRQATLRITELESTMCWVDGVLTALRLGTTLMFIEYMPVISPLLAGQPNMRLEQWLVILFHNLAVVGFPVASVTDEPPSFGVHVRFDSNLPVDHAIAHASQALQQLGCALEFDQVRRGRYTTVGIELVTATGAAVTAAALSVVDAVAYSAGAFDETELANRVRFGRSLKGSGS